MARILCVEDDADIQHLLSLAFQNEGYEAHYAFTGKEGYEKALSLNPDLILLDLMLPVMNGVEVIRLLKQHKKARDIPIIVMTGYPMDPNFVESTIRSLGVLEYIRKPVHLQELMSLTRRILSHHIPRTFPSLKLHKGAVRIDPKFRTVWIHDKLVATLAPKRFEVLFSLVQAQGEVRCEELLKKIWGLGGTKNDLEKAVQRLREDLGPGESHRIKTTPNGYELIG
ncbi:MAG: response regulator transcription factor [Elusimicrobiota bacterium]